MVQDFKRFIHSLGEMMVASLQRPLSSHLMEKLFLVLPKVMVPVAELFFRFRPMVQDFRRFKVLLWVEVYGYPVSLYHQTAQPSTELPTVTTLAVDRFSQC